MGGCMALKSLKNISRNDLTLSDRIRFESKFVKKDEAQCWNWLAYKNKKGYGSIRYRDLGNIAAHRFSYLLYKEYFNQNNIVCHSCDNPSCVNPAHLWLGSHSDNMKDKIRKGRAKNPPPHLGVNHHKAKITPEIVREIRFLFSEGASQTSLCKLYLLHHATMNQICRNKTWKDVR